MTPDEKKALIASKLDKPARPVFTKVVPVETKPAKEDLDHFNVYLPKSVGKALRNFKVDDGRSYIAILAEFVEEGLRKREVKI